MGLIREYYYRFQLLVHEVAKFGVVGAIGFVVQLGVQNGLHSGMKVGPTASVVAAYVVACVVTFVGNRYWAFKHRKGKGLRTEAVTFVALNGVGIVIQVGLVDAFYYGLNMRGNLMYNIATIIGIGLATLFRLWAYRKFVFLAQPPSAEAESLETAPTA